MRRLAGIGVVVALLSGCAWTQVGGNPQRTGTNPFAPGLTLATFDGLSTAWTTADHGALSEQVVVRGDHVVFAGDQALWSASTTTGADQWHVDRTFGHQTNGLVAASTWVDAGHDRVSMSQTWDDVISGTPYFQNLASMTILDLDTGATVATDQPGAPVAPLVTDDWVYLPRDVIVATPASLGGSRIEIEVVARALDGSGTTFTVPLASGVRVVSGLAVDGDWLYLLTRSALLAVPAHGCGSAVCDPTWSVPFPSGSVFGDVAVAGDHVFALDRAGTLRSLPRTCATATCATEWTATLPARATGLAVDRGTVLVTYDSTLAAYPAAGCGATTCTPTWTSAPSAGALTEPTVVNDIVLSGAANGSLLAWPLAGCGAATCAPAKTLPQDAAVGPVSPLPGALVFRVGGAVRKLALPTG